MQMSIARSVERHIPQVENGPLDEPGITFTATGLTIQPGIGFERWERYGRKLQLAEKGIQWAIGDWIVYGENEFGEMYAQAIEVSGLKVKTLQNYATVAKAVDKSRRRDSDVVDFSTHAEVACLPAEEQERILAVAAENPEQATVKKIRREVYKAQRRLGKRKSEIEVLQTPEVQEWLSGLHAAVLPWESTVPQSAPFLKNMIRSILGVIEQQSERTVESDCEAILKMFKGDAGSPGVYAATDSDIFRWLMATFYFMRDPELDDRLGTLSRHSVLEQEAVKQKLPPHRLKCDCVPLNKQLAKIDQGGKKDTQRGDMGDVYMLYSQNTGDAVKIEHAVSNYERRD